MLLKCRDCDIMISVSVSGYGDKNKNPAVCAFPDAFATRWKTCGSCGAPYCEKCAKKRGGLFRSAKCECGGELAEKHNVRL